MRGEIFVDRGMGIEAVVGLGRYPGANAPVVMIAIRLKGLGGSQAQLRFGPFQGEAEAKVALNAACMQAFGRASRNGWKEGRFPAWSLTAMMCLFPSPVGAGVSAAMIVSMCRSVDAGRDPRRAVQESWRKAVAAANEISAVVPTSPPAPAVSSGSEVVVVSATRTAEPWSEMAAGRLSPLAYLKAKWLKRPSGLDMVLAKLGR